MTYTLEDFKRLGIWEEKPIAEDIPPVKPGKAVSIHGLPEKIRTILQSSTIESHNGDFSRQDSSVITAMLSYGISPEDCYVTFASSPRGRHAAMRKIGHFDDYLQRTIRKAVGFLNSSKSGNNHIKVDFGKRKKIAIGEGIVIDMAADIETERTHWVWYPYIPLGKITILAGDPGMGKSTIAIDLVSRISQGTFLPSGARTISGTCLIASAEDAPEDTITPRLIASQANLKRVGIMREVKIDGEDHYLSFPRDLSRLRDAVVSKGARILVIDPLNAFLEKGTDTYKDQDIRLILAPLESIAEETGVSILIVAHLNKKEDSSALYRVGGSIGFIGAARSVLAVGTSQKDNIRVLYSLKSNLAKRAPSLAYEMKQVRKERQNPTDWLGEDKIISNTIRWRGEVDFDPLKGPMSVNDQRKIEMEAESFLHQMITDSEVDTDDLFREARQAGLSRAQLNAVKTKVGIRSRRKNGKWWWSWTE